MKPSSTIHLFFAVLLASALHLQAQTIYFYDPGLGTLPEEQGFTRLEGFPPEPIVSGGALHTFPVPLFPSGVQYWYQSSVPLDFATTPYVLETTLHIITANYVDRPEDGICCGNQRSGYYLIVVDGLGRQFVIGLSSGGIVINTDSGYSASQGVTFTEFDTTDDFHTYRLVIDGGQGTLFIDGVFFASTPVGATGMVPPEVFNRVIFGDASGLGFSEAELSDFRFSELCNSVSLTWLPPLAAQPVVNKIRVGQVVPHKVQVADCQGLLRTGVTVTLKVEGLNASAGVVEQVVEDANGAGIDGMVANDGLMVLSGSQYRFNLDTGNLYSSAAIAAGVVSYRSMVTVSDNSTGLVLGTSAVILKKN